MPYNFVVGHTQPGHWPKNGQYAIYRDEQGNDYPALIKHVYLEHQNPEGTRCGVSAAFLWTTEQMKERPWKVEQWGWQYDKPSGRIFYDPCGPPW